MENNETINLINETLDKIRPFMQREGGDVTFDSFEEGIVFLNVHGACQGCSLLNDDIEQGIEIILMEEVPGVVAVKDASLKEEILNQLKSKK